MKRVIFALSLLVLGFVLTGCHAEADAGHGGADVNVQKNP